MMFVPFTGIDNHRKSVTLGAGLLNNETSDSYIWLLNAFLKTFGVQPRIIVTDQDKAMKIAVDQVLPQSKHRLCMWHITQKLPGKILHDVPDNNEFKKKFNKIVWNMWITPSQFEEDWANLMREYNTQTHKWLTKIYDIRSTWIPAYFADIELCGLMRTTSRSESENSFFGTFNNKRSTLVNFMLCFENAMEKQRYNQDVLDHQTTETVPKYKTQLKIEKHAAKMYTRTIFNLVQIEILKSLWECSIDGLKTEDGFQEYIIKERRKYTEEEAASNEDWESEFWPEDKKTQTYDYKVLYIIEDGSVDCSCKKFTRRGLLCRHIFCVFKNRNIEHIPDKYILRRWTKNPIPVECRKRKRNSTEYDQLLNEASSTFDDCLQLLGSNQERMADFVTKLKQIKMELEDSTSETQPQSKNEIIEQLNGFKKPDICEINNPDVLRYKGCGRDKRLMSTKEKAIKESTKRINKCGKCGLRARGHNSRTCDKKNAEAKAKAAANAKDKAESEASNVAD